MPALFPGSVRIFTPKVDLVDTVMASHVNLLQDEMTAVQTTLGTGILSSSWSGAYTNPTTHTTLSDRLTNIEAGVKESATTLSGVSGDVVGTGNTQTLTNKTLSNPVFTGTITGLPSPNLTITTKTSNYTPNASDANSLIRMSSAGSLVLTLPSDNDSAFPVGATVGIVRAGSGAVTVGAGSGASVSGTPGLNLRDQDSFATAIKTAPNTWLVAGDVVA